MLKKEKQDFIKQDKQETDYKSKLDNIFSKKGSWKLFNKLKIVGKSQWSTVLKVKNKQGRDFAIKVLNLFEFQKEGIMKNVYREVRNLQELNKEKDQTHFVRLIDTLRLQNQSGLIDYCIIMELQQKNLRNFIDQEIKDLPFLQRLKICINLVECMEKLHAKGIIHRDVKPANILLRKMNQNYATVLCDFGLSRKVSQSLKMTLFLGTPKYKHPQIQTKKLNYTYQFDLYSLGLIIYEILTGRFICELTEEEKKNQNHELDNRMKNQLAKIDQILQSTPQLQGGSMRAIKNIIKDCLNFQRAKQLSISNDIKEVLNRIFRQEEFEILKNKQQNSGRESTADTKKTEEQFVELEKDAAQSHLKASQGSKSQISNVNSSKMKNKYFSDLQKHENYQISEENQKIIEIICKKQKFQIQLSQDQDQDQNQQNKNQIKEEYRVSRILQMISINRNKLLMEKVRMGIENDKKKMKEKQKINEKYKKYDRQVKELKKWQEYTIQIKKKRKLIFLALMCMKIQINEDCLSQQFTDLFQNVYRDHLIWCRENIPYHFREEFRQYVTQNKKLNSYKEIMDEFRKTTESEYLSKSMFKQFFDIVLP